MSVKNGFMRNLYGYTLIKSLYYTAEYLYFYFDIIFEFIGTLMKIVSTWTLAPLHIPCFIYAHSIKHFDFIFKLKSESMF